MPGVSCKNAAVDPSVSISTVFACGTFSSEHVMLFKLATSLLIFKFTFADVFTSTAEVELLLKTQDHLMVILMDFLGKQASPSEELLRVYDRILKRRNQVNDPEMFHHPLNSMMMISRLDLDIKDIERLTLSQDFNSTKLLITWLNGSAPVPDDSDVLGVSEAIIRLQQTYYLDTDDLVKGELKLPDGSIKKSYDELTAYECSRIGAAATVTHPETPDIPADFELSMKWYNHSLNRLQEEEIPTVDYVPVAESLSFVTYQTGAVYDAFVLIDSILIRNLTKEQRKRYREIHDWVRDRSTDYVFPEVTEPLIDHNETAQGRFESFCRMHRMVVQPGLTCFHWKTSEPFLKYAFIKVEQVSSNPAIYLFHNVISETEMEVLKIKALPTLKRSGVQSYNAMYSKVNYRISKQTWLKHEQSDVIHTVSQRVQDITGLSIVGAEELQIANYGVAGHFKSHHDFFDDDDYIERTATWMYYLSDVEAGGQTVFTDAGVAIPPAKGNAVFWYNVYLNGSPDLFTAHASCPVLYGNKWAANKWIREHGQEIRRPCGLTIDA